MTVAYIGIGSNLGNREYNCERAVNMLSENGQTVLRQSSMIETGAWGVKNQPSFINMAVSVETSLSPERLLALLKEIEINIGRTETFRWGPRIIDMDILIYDSAVMESPELTIPHPHIQDRDFVLKPLAEIAPDLVHPVFNKKIKELLDALESGN